MKRSYSPIRPLHVAIAAALGLCLSLPLAAHAPAENPTATPAATDTGTAGASAQAADRKFFEKATRANEKEVAAASLARDRAQSQDVRDYAAHLLRDHQDMLVKLDETAVALGVNDERRYVATAGWGSGMNADASARAGAQDDRNDNPPTAAGGTSTGSTVTGRGTGTTATGTTATGTTATATAPTGAGTPYGEGTTASTDVNRSATGMTAQAVPDAARQDPAVRKLADAPADGFDRAFVDQMISDHKKSIEEFTRASRDESLSPQTRELAGNALPKLQGHLAMAETLRGKLADGSRTN